MHLQTKRTAPLLETGAAVVCAAALFFAPVPVSAAGDKAAFPAFELQAGRPLFSQAAATGVVVGQGGNYAVALPGNRTLWLLNNVMTGERKADGQSAVWDITDGAAAFASSTAPASQPGSLEYVSEEQGLPLRLLPAAPGEYGQARKFWPRAGLCAPGRCYVFYSILNNYGSGPYDYFRVGQGVASAEKPGGPYTKAVRAGSPALWNDLEPAFGSAVLEDADGWVYVYGRAMPAPGEYGAALARARAADLASADKYLYYSAGGSSGTWTADPAEASVIMEDVPEDFSVSYNEFLKSYLAVYLDEESGKVLARLARYPWGPWGEPAALTACAKEDYCYGAKEQPAFAAESGRKIFMTVERKNAPYLYEVRFK